ncbi:MAG: preprotein translocase subunit SecG [Candidatus Pacebacteria bacterium]|nr:preprotein translocase subunit SecG [Candidatus Paceibacterota bacterium]
MKTFFMILQLIFSLALISLVLLQAKGSGLTKSLNESGAYHSKKGVEKLVFVSTIAMATLFLITSLVNAFLL